MENENTPAVPRSVDVIPCPPRSLLSFAAPATTGSVCHDLRRIYFFFQRLDDNCPDQPGGSRGLWYLVLSSDPETTALFEVGGRRYDL